MECRQNESKLAQGGATTGSPSPLVPSLSPSPAKLENPHPQAQPAPRPACPRDHSPWELGGGACGGGSAFPGVRDPRVSTLPASACVVSVLCFYIYIYISIILLKNKQKKASS